MPLLNQTALNTFCCYWHSLTVMAVLLEKGDSLRKRVYTKFCAAMTMQNFPFTDTPCGPAVATAAAANNSGHYKCLPEVELSLVTAVCIIMWLPFTYIAKHVFFLKSNMLNLQLARFGVNAAKQDGCLTACSPKVRERRTSRLFADFPLCCFQTANVVLSHSEPSIPAQIKAALCTNME